MDKWGVCKHVHNIQLVEGGALEFLGHKKDIDTRTVSEHLICQVSQIMLYQLYCVICYGCDNLILVESDQ